MNEDPEQGYIVVVSVAVRGYGKKAHQEQTVERIRRELGLRFGNGVEVTVLDVRKAP